MWSEGTYHLEALNMLFCFFCLFMMVQLQFRPHRQSKHSKLHRRFAFITEFPGSQSSGRDSPFSGCVLRPKAVTALLFK